MFVSLRTGSETVLFGRSCHRPLPQLRQADPDGASAAKDSRLCQFFYPAGTGSHWQPLGHCQLQGVELAVDAPSWAGFTPIRPAGSAGMRQWGL